MSEYITSVLTDHWSLLVKISFIQSGTWSVGNLLRGDPRFLRGQRYFSGSVYITLGAVTAFTGLNKSIGLRNHRLLTLISFSLSFHACGPTLRSRQLLESLNVESKTFAACISSM
jgi:hypothetical protein